MEDCCEHGLQAQITCLQDKVSILWDNAFGDESRQFIFVGNIGAPVATSTDFLATIERDRKEYTYGAGLVNSLNPDGLFILGDANFDVIPARSNTPPHAFPASYNLINQESKITLGFSDLLLKKKIWPVMGDLDYWAAQYALRMDETYLRLFDYLPDAKRYYSMYDDKSNTEFFVLSSGIGRSYREPGVTEQQAVVYVDDNVIGSDQHTWFVQRAAASPAKNKVVVFSDPFTSIINTQFYGHRNQGPHNVDIGAPFAQWDFLGAGVKLIINGHSGNSFHLRKGTMNIVNSSAFIRSRFGSTEIPVLANPPNITTLYGDQGWALLYKSVLSVNNGAVTPAPENVWQPSVGIYVNPKNEFTRITANKAGIKVDFISFNPYVGSMQEAVASANIEYSFEISANE